MTNSITNINQLPEECLLPILAQCGQLGTICQVSKKWNLLGEHLKQNQLQSVFNSRISREDNQPKARREIIWFNGNIGIELSPLLKNFLIHHFRYFESLWGSTHNFSYQENANHELNLDDIDLENVKQMVKVIAERRGVTGENILSLTELESRFGSSLLRKMCDFVLADYISQYECNEESFNNLLEFLKEGNLLGEQSQAAATKFLDKYLYECINEDKEKFSAELDKLKDCSLNELSFQGCAGFAIQDKDLEKVANITSLKSFKILPSVHTDEGLKILANLTSLTSLRYGSDNITNGGLKILAKFTSLTSLGLWVPCTKDAGLQSLRNLPSLTFLSLDGNDMTDEGLEFLANLSSLHSLSLAHCYNITGEGLNFLANPPSLTFLNLEGCTTITDSGLKSLERLISLTSLNLKSCGIKESGLSSLGKLTSLTSLDLSRLFQITEAGLASLENLPSLIALDLGECYIINSGLASIAKFPSLISINLLGCKFITEEDIRNLMEKTASKNLMQVSH